jgi:hypothetical protein
MERRIEDITHELVNLSRRERLEIVRFLLFLDDRSSESDNIDAEWEKEISKRVQLVDEGKAVGYDFDEVMENIEKRFEVR